jgi:hypothetical protein
VQLGATPISPSTPVQSVDELADQVADVLDFFGYTDSQFFFGNGQMILSTSLN